MRKTLGAFFVAFTFAGVALAAPPSGLRECSRIDDSVKRLECFDRLAAKNAPKPAKSADWNTGTIPNHKWTVKNDVSRIDDSTNVTLSVESTDAIRDKFGGATRLTLAILCREKTTNAFFVFGKHFMSDHAGSGRVTLRIDRQPAITRDLRASTDHHALGFWNGRTAIPFAKSLFGARKLLIRATPYSESPLTAEFDVTGLENAIRPLREACMW